MSKTYGFFKPIDNNPNQINSLFNKLDKELNRFCDDDEVMNKIKKLIEVIKKKVLI